ncbi:MAG: HlyD family efflux transporter periplasmic adaptor subunit [Planctomycetota bacterium]
MNTSRRLLSHLLPSLVLAVVLPVASAADPGPDRAVVQQQEVLPWVEVPGRSFARDQTLLTNPVPWKPIADVVPDGAAVRAGQEVAVFDALDLERHLAGLRLQKAIDDQELANRLAKIDDQLIGLRDRVADIQAQLRVARAERATLAALPSQTEITIAQGRLRIARMEHLAAVEAAQQAVDRHERGLIGAGEVARMQAERAITEAQQQHAQAMLAAARQAADPLELERADLRIANLQLDLDKAQDNYAKREAIAELRRDNASRSTARIERKIAEAEEDLTKLRVTAPTDGFVLYTDRFKRALDENGGKLWRNTQFMRIPDADSLAFKTTVPEWQRPWFRAGDAATIIVPGPENLRLQGRISRIGDMPRDRAQDETGNWGEQDSKSGLKVYDITVTCDDPPASMRPGRNVHIALQAREPLTAPALPLDFVRYRDGIPYAAVDGIERRVDGQAVAGWFVLDGEGLPPGTVVLRHGRQAPARTAGPRQEDAPPVIPGAPLRVDGELVPRDTVDIRVENIHWHGSKITWLLEEGERVEAGDVVARLDDEEISKEIDKQQNNVDNRQNQLDTEQEELAILQAESAVDLEKKQNDLRKAEIDHILGTQQDDPWKVAGAERDLAIATVRLEEARRALANLRDRDPELVSETELAQQERDLHRRELEHERARIQLDQARAGPDQLARRRIALGWQKAQLDYATARMRIDYDLSRQERSLQRDRVRLHRAERWLNELEDRRDNLEVTAPADGLLQYNFVWSDSGLRKVEKGSSVRGGFRIMKVADTSRMTVRVELPEAYFTLVAPDMQVRVHGEEIPEMAGTVSEIEYVFQARRRNDTDVGLYSEREPPGETVFFVHVLLADAGARELKPGALVTVEFPFTVDAAIAQDTGLAGRP